jgi:hypothetical protein
MTNEVIAGEPFGPVSVRSEDGAVEFRRDCPTDAMLHIEYRNPEIAVELDGDSPESLQTAVEAACDTEIAHMRHSLRSLGDELSSQLSDEGRDLAIHQEFDDEDERTWLDRNTAFLVRPSVIESDIRLNGYEGASDAKLVKKTVEITIAQREDSIRTLYREILADAIAARAPRGTTANVPHATGGFPSGLGVYSDGSEQ